ncbi:hypothetical protein ElyMa_001003000 [Elysia marginata]|uniref:Uncharacterized protein n=1 Tax=Elysia marginata TaxID=1093978 RepID=A0AAV4HHT9_9GAST|nr:hypothetical protein ElyMa_001003000 [Elysia marginata]
MPNGSDQGNTTSKIASSKKNEPPHLRRKKARLNYWTTTNINPTNPAKEIYSNPFKQTSAASIKNLSPVSTDAAEQTLQDLQDIIIKKEDIMSRTPDIPPRTLEAINTDAYLSTILGRKKNSQTEKNLRQQL